jgi:hypothetical protein
LYPLPFRKASAMARLPAPTQERDMRHDSLSPSRGGALLPACCLPAHMSAPPLRGLLAEAAEHRRRGDLAAADALEMDALRVLRVILAAARAGGAA